ncbi:reverse transcriptase [Tanacetum coccineum]
MELKKLKQDRIVKDCQEKFEALLNMVELEEKHEISLFLGGLKNEISLQIRMFTLHTLTKAFYMAKMQEQTLVALKSSYSNPNTKRLTQKEYEEKRDNNLCFYCDKKYVHGHKCTGQLYSLVVMGDNEGEEGMEAETVEMGNDGGEIIETDTAKTLRCKMKRTCPLLVSVANGQDMTTISMCHQLALTVGNMTYEIDVMVLPLVACEMVLRHVMLRGTPQATRQWMQGNKVYKGTLMMCVCSPMLLQMETKEENMAKVESVVKDFDDVFALPTALPPKKHPPVQKDAIEQMVNELLESGVIRHSQSPFASLIVMVKKKDGSWRMCVDYKQLNKSTIKDKFPIPIIEELIDELSGATVFSKLDLRPGYHQIRIKEDDIEKTAFRTRDGHLSSWKFTLVFFDDILVYSKNMEEHEQHLRMVLTALDTGRVFVFEGNVVKYVVSPWLHSASNLIARLEDIERFS